MGKRKESSGDSKIAFIACSKKKNNVSCISKNMYQGALFKKSLKYCFIKYDEIFILSAKYGLLELNEIIEPYNETLNNKSKKQKREWADKIKKSMRDKKIFSKNVDIFAGKNYYKYLNYNKIPLADKKGLGYQLQFLTKELKKLNFKKGFF